MEKLKPLQEKRDSLNGRAEMPQQNTVISFYSADRMPTQTIARRIVAPSADRDPFGRMNEVEIGKQNT